MRLFRHLTFSNVIAVLALFIALGGAAYAGSKINGKSIVNKSIGGGKLKNETITANKIKKGTITSAQIAPGSIDSTQINVNSLTTVPSATTATTATTAKTAETATTATTATSAETATKATSAVTADTAGEADTATSADNATHATEADRATIAGEAEKLGGATRADLTLSCKSGTEPFGGMCWDESQRTARSWIEAIEDCSSESGRLPTIGELVAFILQPGPQAIGQVWSSDLADVSGGSEEVLTSDESGRGKFFSILSHGYRCVFLPTN